MKVRGLLTAVDEQDDSMGIPQFVSPADDVVKPRTKPPAQVIDLHSLAQALKVILEYERPRSFEPINFVKSLTTTAQTYQLLAQWMPKAPGGVLKEISVTNDPGANYRLVIGGDEMFKDVPLSAALTIDYQRMRVQGANDKDITIYIKSISGASITVQGLINGEQDLAT